MVRGVALRCATHARVKTDRRRPSSRPSLFSQERNVVRSVLCPSAGDEQVVDHRRPFFFVYFCVICGASRGASSFY